jgi:hypothetical protein
MHLNLMPGGLHFFDADMELPISGESGGPSAGDAAGIGSFWTWNLFLTRAFFSLSRQR